MSRLKRQASFSLWQVLEQLHNDSGSGEEFANKDSDPLLDFAVRFDDDLDEHISPFLIIHNSGL